MLPAAVSVTLCRRWCGRSRFKAGCWSRLPVVAICRSSSAAPVSKSHRLILAVRRIWRVL